MKVCGTIRSFLCFVFASSRYSCTARQIQAEFAAENGMVVHLPALILDPANWLLAAMDVDAGVQRNPIVVQRQ